MNPKNFGYKNFWVQKSQVKDLALKNVSKKNLCTYLQSLVKIQSVTAAEIFLIWTNVARTNVASTNVNLIVGICSRCSKEAIFKVSSKPGQ